MKNIILASLLVLLAGCSEKDLRKTYEIINQSAQQVPLKKPEVVAALKDSLSRGISKGAIIASAQDGYFKNPRLKIGFPDDVVRVEKKLRQIGLGKEVDRFVLQLNRGAEAAASQAKPIFIKAITEMSMRDAFGILNGPPDAATQYLKRTTGKQLRTQFQPVISDTLDQTSATRYYGRIVESYNRIPGVRKVSPDLETYATESAIDGLFLLIADEEANIRANPAARSTQLLRRVFGSLD